MPGPLLQRPRREHLSDRGRVPADAHDPAARDQAPDDAGEPARRGHRGGPAVHGRPRGVRRADDRVRRDAAGAREAVPGALPADAPQRAHPPAGPDGLPAGGTRRARAPAGQEGGRGRRLRGHHQGGVPAGNPRAVRGDRRQLEADAAALPGIRHRAARCGPHHAPGRDRHERAPGLRARRGRDDP